MPKSNLLNSRLGALHHKVSDMKGLMAHIDGSNYEAYIIANLRELQVKLAEVQGFVIEAIEIAQIDYDRRVK